MIDAILGIVWKQLKFLKRHKDDWVNIANDFHGRTQFPNCVGAVDGKHVRIKMPSKSGTLFHNYKHFSILLWALLDADYRFISVAVVAIGSPVTPMFLRIQTHKGNWS